MRYMGQLGLPIKSCGEDTTHLRRALVCGLFPHAARRQPEGTYKVRGQSHPACFGESRVCDYECLACFVVGQQASQDGNERWCRAHLRMG